MHAASESCADPRRRAADAYARFFESVAGVAPLLDPRLVREFADACTIHSVLPERVIAYWAARMCDFEPSSFPPLAFLAAAGVVGEAAASTLREARACALRPPDPRLRRFLAEQGIDTAGLSDRHLALLQAQADLVAGGERLFVSSSMAQTLKLCTRFVSGGVQNRTKQA